MFTEVIWATDGSEHAARAMDVAVEVAKGDGADLHISPCPVLAVSPSAVRAAQLAREPAAAAG
jgi:nucleotide-binding universal stress UspA family protein